MQAKVELMCYSIALVENILSSKIDKVSDDLNSRESSIMAMTTELSTVQQPARRILFIFLGGYATNNVYNVIYAF